MNLAPQDYPDANPNTVVSTSRGTFVADAGANVLTQVLDHGRTRVRAFFPVPNYPPDAVATCVVQGPDKALYVTELLGGSYDPGHARVWRVVPGQKPKVWATGLTTVQGCGFGSDGAFYATEFQTAGLTANNPAGDVVRIAPNGHRTHLGVGKLFNPSGFLAGPHGSFYVSNCSIAPATGMGLQLCPNGARWSASGDVADLSRLPARAAARLRGLARLWPGRPDEDRRPRVAGHVPEGLTGSINASW